MIVYNSKTFTFKSSLFPNITHGFGTRMSGNGRDPEKIKTYLNLHNIRFSKFIDPDQQHTDNIDIVGRLYTTPGVGDGCDGLITSEKGVVLTMITADCAPILYIDSVKNVVGISHNGRKGTEKKLAMKMITQLRATGSELQDIRVAIGPAIGACCYPMNLVEENVKQLMGVGLKKDQIDFFPFCTKCDAKRLFSYRGSEDKQNFPEQFSFILLDITPGVV